MEATRTKAELENLKLNYYVAYNIAPSEKDSNKIKAAMDPIKNTFSGGEGDKRRLAELVNDAVKVMTNASSREEEFQRAKRLKLEAAEKTLEPIRRGNRPILKSYLINLANGSNKWFTVDELEKQIAHLLRSGARMVDDTQRNLDLRNYYNEIKKRLEKAGKSDLYDLVGLPRTASPGDLVSAATAEYSKAQASTKKNSVITATGEANSIAKTIFGDPKKKKYYDAYLATKDIWDELFNMNVGKILIIDEKHFLDYCQKAKTALKTTDTNYVEVLLQEGLLYFNISVVGENSAAAKAEADRIKAEADRKLKEAQAKIDQAQAEADRKLREAQAKIDKANADADRKVREAQAEAKRIKDEADRKTAEAKRLKDEADKIKEDATKPTNTWPSPPPIKSTPPVSDDWTWTTPPPKKYTPPPMPDKGYTPPPMPKKYTPPPMPNKGYTPPPMPNKGYTPPPMPKQSYSPPPMPNKGYTPPPMPKK